MDKQRDYLTTNGNSRLCPGQFHAIDPDGLGGERGGPADHDDRDDVYHVAVKYERPVRDWWADPLGTGQYFAECDENGISGDFDVSRSFHDPSNGGGRRPGHHHGPFCLPQCYG
nr:hypothetical protein [Limosilactobacillus reuteri]